VPEERSWEDIAEAIAEEVHQTFPELHVLAQGFVRQDTKNDAAQGVAGGPFIKTDPISVPAGAAAGSTMVSWSTGTGVAGEVYVSVNGGPEVLFQTGPEGNASADWIYSGASYEFRLYADSEKQSVIASTTVSRR